MVSYLNGELCNILGNLLNRCTSKSVNTSQIYQPLNHSIYDSMWNLKWSEMMHNLRELPGGLYMKCSIFFRLHTMASSHEWFKHEGGLSNAFYF